MTVFRNGCLEIWINHSPRTLPQMRPNYRAHEPASVEECQALPSCSKILNEVWGRRRIPDAFHRVEWPLVVTLREVVRIWLQTDHRWRTVHAAVRLLECDGWTGRPRGLDSFTQRINWTEGYGTLTVLPPCELDRLVKGPELGRPGGSQTTEESWNPTDTR